MDRHGRAQRWAGTRRTALAGTLLGTVGGAVTGALALVGDPELSTGSELALGVFYGAPFGALFGAASGLVSGTVGGCLAVHLVREHVVLARAVLAVCCGALIAAASAWSLPPGPVHLVGTVLATAAAVAAAWLSASWCFRPLRTDDGPTG
ncbi:hypothetical protein [Kineococcus rubinsiae]|uniref:hypothetical protein n=1 Tax=Kineococcus rubinsiae TaxID=2609562 RepID=UPI0014302B81|nr:hypothetical protein [Kineococcus rubinsiae]NIZ90285.1 hypothetical protein [Kineococcus rubinsiae]